MSFEKKTFLLSVVTPAYNEAENLPLLYERLCDVLGETNVDWEWIVVDDHSADNSPQVLRDLAARDARLRAYRFSRNFGSHMALRCGFDQARGDCVVAIAGDLQDPPEVIPDLIARWQEGLQVVWAVRSQRLGEKSSTVAASRLYYFVMRRIVGITDMPSEGADFFLLDREVAAALARFGERNTSILALITWMGFRQGHIEYDKQARLHGKSGWSFQQKFKLAIDSITSFSYKPIRIMSAIGFILALVAFLYLIVVIINGLRGIAPYGWASQMAVILFIGGLQILMMGILGEYIWRSLDESRRRPGYVIEERIESLKDTISNDR